MVAIFTCRRTSLIQSSWGQPGKGKISKTMWMSSVIYFMEMMQNQPTHHYKPCKALMCAVSTEFLICCLSQVHMSMCEWHFKTLQLWPFKMVVHRDSDRWVLETFVSCSGSKLWYKVWRRERWGRVRRG